MTGGLLRWALVLAEGGACASTAQAFEKPGLLSDPDFSRPPGSQEDVINSGERGKAAGSLRNQAAQSSL